MHFLRNLFSGSKIKSIDCVDRATNKIVPPTNCVGKEVPQDQPCQIDNCQESKSSFGILNFQEIYLSLCNYILCPAGLVIFLSKGVYTK